MFIKIRTLQHKTSSKSKSQKLLVLTKTVHNLKISAPNIAFCPILEYYEHVV